MKRKTIKYIAAAMAASMALTACGGSTTSSDSGTTTAAAESASAGSTGAEATTAAAGTDSATISVADPNASYKDTLNIAVAQQAPSLDLHKNSSLIARQMMDGTCWEKLVTLNANGEAVPELCESYEVSEDAKTITFILRKGVKFHDGSEMTADDVVASMNRWINGFSTARAAVGEGAEFEKVDDYTVKITSESSLLLFPTVIAGATQPAVITTAAACANEDGNGYMTDYIGTGPYKMTEWDEGQAIVLEKNEDYFKGEPNIDEVIFKIVPDDNAKALQMDSGELDLALLTPKDAQGFADKEGYTCYDMKTSDYRGILFNFNNEYWTVNKDIIPAVCYGIDREAIIQAVLLGQGMPAYGPLQRNIYNDENVEHYDYNLEKSAEIFEATGCTQDADGYWCRNGERISFTINATPGDQVRIDIAQIAAQQLREAGLDVKADVPAGGIDWAGQECCIIGWGSPFDADDHTYKVFGTDKGANYNGYSNEKVDAYLKAARETTDENERMTQYALFQKELAKTPAYTFFCYIDAMYVGAKNISGIDQNTVLGHHGVGIFWNVCDWTISE